MKSSPGFCEDVLFHQKRLVWGFLLNGGKLVVYDDGALFGGGGGAVAEPRTGS